MDFLSEGDLPSMPPMANTLLNLDDFPSKESTSNMTPPMDCLSSGFETNYDERDNLIKKEERVPQSPQEKTILMKKRPRKVTKKAAENNSEEGVTQSPQVLDQQEKKKRPRKVTNQPMINNSEDQQHKSDDDRGNRKRVRAEQKKRKRKRKRRNITEVPVREMDDEFKNLITSKGGSLESLKLVIQKKLFETDVNPDQSRLSIPRKKIINRFLEQEEDEYLDSRNGDKMNEKRVMLIEPSREVSEINLRKWFIKTADEKETWSYVLVTGWNQVVERNGLREGTVVQLWAFRNDNDLCFALVKLKD